MLLPLGTIALLLVVLWRRRWLLLFLLLAEGVESFSGLFSSSLTTPTSSNVNSVFIGDESESTSFCAGELLELRRPWACLLPLLATLPPFGVSLDGGVVGGGGCQSWFFPVVTSTELLEAVVEEEVVLVEEEEEVIRACSCC